MNSRTTARQHADMFGPSRRGARSASLGAAAFIPGPDVLIVFAAAFLALSVFELAAWLATAPLTTLIYSLVALVPVTLFLTSLVSARKR
jgi:hypothetical protein